MMEKKITTVREFVCKHLNENISMMTPGGYVNLLASETKQFLKGESLGTHLGVRETEFTIGAEELLDQVLMNQNYSEKDSRWFILTGLAEKHEIGIIKELEEDISETEPIFEQELS